MSISSSSIMLKNRAASVHDIFFRYSERVFFNFLKKSKTSNLNAVITGKRQREIGLVLPAENSFEIDDRKCAEKLEKELMTRKELFPAVALKFKKKGFYRKFPVYSE